MKSTYTVFAVLVTVANSLAFAATPKCSMEYRLTRGHWRLPTGCSQSVLRVVRYRCVSAQNV
jgi:hypothetical protein